jgi:hypothetical protein
MISDHRKRQILLVSSPVYRNCHPSHKNTALRYHHDHPMALAPTTASVTLTENPTTITNSSTPCKKKPQISPLQIITAPVSATSIGPVQTTGISTHRLQKLTHGLSQKPSQHLKFDLPGN